MICLFACSSDIDRISRSIVWPPFLKGRAACSRRSASFKKEVAPERRSKQYGVSGKFVLDLNSLNASQRDLAGHLAGVLGMYLCCIHVCA